MTSPLSIISAGAYTPAGYTLAANAATFRSGLNSFHKPAHFREKGRGELITVSALESLEEVSAVGRMRCLALKAAKEACQPLAHLPAPRVGFLLAAGEERPGIQHYLPEDLSRAVIKNLPLPIEKQYCHGQMAGNAGALLLLQKAHDLLESRAVDVCLLGGVDSYIARESLDWLEQQGRLKSSEQPNGILPGEGAAFLGMTTKEMAGQLGLTTLAQIMGIASAQEPKARHSGEVSLGQGLTQTIRQSFLDANAEQADAVFGDINGESWRSDEWSYACLRNGKRFKSPLTIFHPASSFGETGAAAAPLALAVGAVALSRRNQLDNAYLVWSASGTSGLRASCLLEKAGTQ